MPKVPKQAKISKDEHNDGTNATAIAPMPLKLRPKRAKTSKNEEKQAKTSVPLKLRPKLAKRSK